MTQPTTSGRHLSRFEIRPKITHPMALFALNQMQCQRRLQISRTKNIGNVLEQGGVAFRLAPSHGGLLVYWVIFYHILALVTFSSWGVGYNFTIYFQSDVIAIKMSKMSYPLTLSRTLYPHLGNGVTHDLIDDGVSNITSGRMGGRLGMSWSEPNNSKTLRDRTCMSTGS